MFLNFYLTHVLKHLLDFHKILSFIPSGAIILYSFYLSTISEYGTPYSHALPYSKRKNKLPLQVKDINP